MLRYSMLYETLRTPGGFGWLQGRGLKRKARYYVTRSGLSTELRGCDAKPLIARALTSTGLPASLPPVQTVANDYEQVLP